MLNVDHRPSIPSQCPDGGYTKGGTVEVPLMAMAVRVNEKEM
jgi:hypothetical protein